MNNNVFENIEDIKIVQDIIGSTSFIEYGEPDIIDNQSGRSIVIDGIIEMMPYKTSIVHPTLTGEEIRKEIRWDVTASYRVPSCNRDEPDDYDEKNLGVTLSFPQAMEIIVIEMARWKINNVLEACSYKDLEIDEEKNPEEAWPQCMELTEDK